MKSHYFVFRFGHCQTKCVVDTIVELRAIRVALISILFDAWDSTICLSSFFVVWILYCIPASYRTPTADVFSICVSINFCQPLHKQEYFRQLHAVIITYYVVEPLGLCAVPFEWHERKTKQKDFRMDVRARPFQMWLTLLRLSIFRSSFFFYTFSSSHSIVSYILPIAAAVTAVVHTSAFGKPQNNNPNIITNW